MPLGNLPLIDKTIYDPQRPDRTLTTQCKYHSQEVLKELLSEKLPQLSAHFSKHGIDASLFSLNWFLCLFVDNIPVKTYLHIWDSFLFEGSKVR